MNYYAVERTGDHLEHYGVKGMRWGVRRYQKADGSLTTKGKARIAKSGSYLNPSKKGKDKRHTTNRTAVSDQYVSEWSKKIRPITGEADYGPNAAEKKVWDKYKSQYASATLKDMKLNDNKKAREHVKRIFNDIDPHYKYDNPDKYSEEKYNAYIERQKKYAHPTKEKIKKAIKKSGIKQDIRDGLKAAGLSVFMGPMASNYITSKKAVNCHNKKKCR